MENSNDKQFTFFRFEDLRVYHKSLAYTVWVSDASKLNADSNSELMKRFNLSAQNIALNIAEGSARNKSQFIYYLKMAKSAVRECLVFTSISFNQGLITETLDQESRNQLMEMTKMIGALISSLQRSVTKDEETEDYHEKVDVDANSY